VIARTRREVEKLKDALETRGQSCHLLDGRSAPTPPGALNLATMHRVKGLEFDAVFLASANRGLVPLDFVVNAAADAVTRQQCENEERALLYVSLTRARKCAYVFSSGALSEWFGAGS
jgi:superfamily I DNA/RNA helicase